MIVQCSNSLDTSLYVIYVGFFMSIYGPAHEILVLIACAQIPLINAHTDISSRARGLNFVLSLYLKCVEKVRSEVK